MKLPDTFHIDGGSYGLSQLKEHCGLVCSEEGQPGWKRKVFAFIRNFLDESAELEQRSSGTTGDPKVFMLEREAMLRSAKLTLDFFKLQELDRVLLALPVDYIAGRMMVVRALLGRLELVLAEPSARPLASIEGEFSLVPMVPLQVHESLEAGDELARCGRLLVGGGALEGSLLEKLAATGEPELWASFGMSETYTHFALQRINGPRPDKEFHCLPGVEISTDERDCLVVEIPGITEGAVKTNDLVMLTRKGKGFRWQGRYDNVINTGGIKIIPEILEEKISGILGVKVLILSRPHKKLGQQLVLLAECLPGRFDPGKWKQELKAVLPAHEVPRLFFRTERIPRNDSMKPDRLLALSLLA